MATAAQVEANRRNAQRSTGPTSPAGRAVSGQNPRRHGLASETIFFEKAHPDFAARLALWASETPVETLEQQIALETAVAMSFRIEECGAAYHDAVAGHQERAAHAWDFDRAGEAADDLARLARRPEAVSARMKTYAHGLAAMIRAWERLAASLDEHGDWSDDEVAFACDLLGIPRALRRGRLPFDPIDRQADPVASRRAFVASEVETLTSDLNELMLPLDSLEREHSASGCYAILSKNVQLILRYEREAYRRFERAMRVVNSVARGPIEETREVGSPEPPYHKPAPRPAPGRPGIEKRPTSTASGLDARSPETATVASSLLGAFHSETVRRERVDAESPDRESPSPGPVPIPAPKPFLNRHQRRRREALARHGG